MKRQIFILALLLVATQQVSVSKTDNCDTCTQFKSSTDCKSFGCTWTDKTATTAGSCAATVDPYVQFCSTVDTPATNCAKQRGCAYDSGKCVPFPGCSAYAKSSTAECQAISYLCVYDGKQQCTDVQDCANYSNDVCETTPSLYSPYKCKLDGTTCRVFKCEEADVSLTTDKACSAWLAGCVTTGQGCTSSLGACATYTGTATTCPLIKGTDGTCDFDSANSKCKARDCVNAPATTTTDADCGTYKTGCVTTGKGCISARAGCSSYSGNATTCLGYIGSDGDCTGDATGTTCRAKKCEDKAGTSNTDCNTWKLNCITNGKGCVAALTACSSYTGTTTTCLGYIGNDGNCKGTSATAGACAPKDCTTDAKGTETTNAQCQTIQSNCLTTGKGCVKTLSLCSSYTDDGTVCPSLVGSDGKCKAGTGGKCAVKVCTDAPASATTNSACDTYQTGCVTTGAGCVAQQTCTDVSVQATCVGSTANNCGWNPICTANSSCGDFKTKSLCNGYKISNKPCIWDSTQATPCRAALCTDFKGATDGACDTQLTGCVSNGTDCLDGTDCSKFKGLKATCEGYKAKCTNLASVTDTAANCVDKSCSDSDLTYDNDTDCGNYLSTCVTKGTGCIDKTSGCSAYSGSPAQCDKFKGNGTDRCWNTNASGQCTVKLCTHATTGMTDNASCDAFLSGCLFNGGTGCVDKTADCDVYTGDGTSCPTFSGSNGTHICADDPAGSQCKVKSCSDNTTATSDSDCGTFLSGCLTKGTGCIDPSSACSSYQGTYTQCGAFTGNKIQCTRLEACASLTCAGKTDAATNTACVTYHSTCRLQQGTTNCFTAPTDCLGFTSFAGTATDTDKQTFCNSVTDASGKACSYDSGVAAKCAVRACNLWVSTLSVTCKDYNGLNSCVQNTNDSKCYTPAACDSYTIPASVTGKTNRVAWCAAIKDTTGSSCIYDSHGDVCVNALTTCEQIDPATDASQCNQTLNSGQCQFSGSKCVTTNTACTGYSLTGITTQAAYCAALYQNSAGAIKQCFYNSGVSATCSTVTACEDIPNPSSQDDCDAVSGCTYYSSQCFTRKACTQWSAIPSAFTTTTNTKQLFCQNMVDGAGTDYCSFGTGTACGAAKSCTDYTGLPAGDSGNPALCLSYRDKTGPICYMATPASDTACAITTAAAICTSVATPATQSVCDTLTTPNICHKDTTTCVANSKCASISVSGQTNILSYCQSQRGDDGLFCTSTDGAACAAGLDSCANWNSLPGSGKLDYCLARKDKNGIQCSYLSGTNCTPFGCADLASPKSQIDCDNESTGCFYHPQNKKCIAKQATCDLYTPSGTADKDKLSFCNSVTSTAGACTFIKGKAACIAKGACTSYNVSADVTDKVNACQSIATTDGAGCTYFGSGNTCIVKVACTSYTGGTTLTLTADCNKQTDTSSNKCYPAFGANATACRAAITNCSDITDATSQGYCDIYKSGCIYYSSTCFDPKSDCKYDTTASSSKAISFCGALKNTKGDYCTADLDTDGTCRDRKCDDDAAGVFVTHQDCQTYSSLCKSNGTGCVAASTTTCAQQSGNPGFCAWALDSDGKNVCAAATSVKGACADFDCTQNVIATTDAACIAFNANCLTSGNGCIAKTEPCTSYNGKQADCAKFTGNGKKCWGASTTILAACKDKVCSDNTTAKTQADCDGFLTGCIYSGQGCVDASAPCGSYKGTQTDCAGFMGSNKTVYCWGTSTTSSIACIARACTHKTAGTTDADCGSFMAPISPSTTPLCITNGTSCISYGQVCSVFSGNDESCAKFTSSEGTCKASVYSTSAVACAPRVCYEAPNSLTTDAQCASYQKGCKTTGKGCIASPSCSDLQTTSACSAATGCLWASQCRSLPTLCSSFTSSGQSICINTPLQNGKSCAWYNGTCRDFTCADYDASLVQHADCSKKDLTCTTSGAGCVTIGACSTYKSRTVCEAANTTDVSLRCTWNTTTNSCRQRICTDGNLTTDTDCNTFLAGCKSTGASCVGPTYGCSVFTGFPKKCLQNSTGQPCIRVNDVCYDFDDCTDAPFNDLTTCQKFSPLCIPNTTNCKAMTFCEKYENQIQCTSGLTSTATAACGWQPTGKCATYTNCGDAAGTTLTDCVNWNSKCVSDGTKCVDKGTCSTYGNETACGNVGTDGLCKWTGSACKLRECTDNIAVTDTDCAAYTVATGICTTDGTKCVLRAACSSYTEQGCFYGQDGIPCVFDFPVGTTTGTKSCRPKECADIKGATNDLCVGQIPNKKCVSDGTACVKQDTCANYKNQTSCKAGGSDGACAFTPVPTATNANAGTCALFNSCAAANKDQNACSTKPKQCKWSSTTSGTTTTTTCAAMDCASAASGTNCVAVPNFDSSSYTVCVLTGGACTAGDPSTITQDQCYKSTVYSYTWNESTNKCVSCKGTTTPTNNSTGGNTTNTTNTTTDSGYILGVTIPLAIIGLFA